MLSSETEYQEKSTNEEVKFYCCWLEAKQKMIVAPLGGLIPIDVMKEVFLLYADEVQVKSLSRFNLSHIVNDNHFECRLTLIKRIKVLVHSRINCDVDVIRYCACDAVVD